MSERDYNKQVMKRQRISGRTLVVGVDVGNAFNAVGFMSKSGRVLGSCAGSALRSLGPWLLWY